jgi:hypothetical protein
MKWGRRRRWAEVEPWRVKDRYGEPERGEWMGADKKSSRRRWRLLQDEHDFQHTSPTLYPSWPSPRSHWSATGPRSQHATFRAKTHQHAQRKLARLAACAAPVRPMACVGQTGDTSQTGGQRRSGRWLQQPHNKCSRKPQWLLQALEQNHPKTQPTPKENPTQNVTKQLQTDQELTSSTKTQRHTSQVVHPRQIPQETHTGQTGQEHRSDRCSLGSSGWTTPAGQLLQNQTSISRIAPRIWTRLWGW